ncbi:MAG TPA: 2-amino-4-hydroxy-6-hydroxymethyldihydropteridine diphosphokinase [Blastocatellia bacterium]|nr:2-amino-4-hydroxy-6-hydroxymethyldihydropteridine diphosphokinase [Blastocatellia bacterium]
MTANEGHNLTLTVFIGLGSNLGDRAGNLCAAIEQIESLARVIRVSSIYETEPVGYTDQPWFLNQVIETELDLEPESGSIDLVERATALLDALLEIETRMGRQRSIKGGPRVIDLDLLIFGSLILGYERERAVEEPHIVIPHPRMHLRRFVLEPLCEIAPSLVHVRLKKTIAQLRLELEDESVVRRV